MIFVVRSQGKSQPRRRSRQSHLGQTLQRCPVLPSHHRRNARRSPKDQWKLGEAGFERFGGEGPD